MFHCESKLSTLSVICGFNLHFKRFKVIYNGSLKLFVRMYCTHVCTYMVSILEGTIKKVWGFNAILYKDIELRKCTCKSILLKSILGRVNNDFWLFSKVETLKVLVIIVYLNTFSKLLNS